MLADERPFSDNRVAEARSTPRPGRWASGTLDRSLLWTLAVLIASWHLIMIGVLVITVDDGMTVLVLGSAHALVALFAWVAAYQRRNRGIWIVGFSAVLIAIDMGLAPSLDAPLTLAVAWLWNLTNATAAFLFRGRAGSLLALAVPLLLSFSLTVSQPEWGLDFPVATAVTGVTIILVARLGLRALQAFAAHADGHAQRAQERRERVGVERAAREAIAESRRTLHDTVINTLGAIAEGPGRSHREAIRRICAQDSRAVTALLSSASTDAAPGELTLEEVAAAAGIEVVRSGLDEEALEEHLARLPAQVSSAVRGATREALRNVAKHSGAERATVDATVAVDGTLVITVQDDGVGFDDDVAHGHGLSESIVARCLEAGVHVAVTTAPGAGTTVRLECASSEVAGVRSRSEPRAAALVTETFQRRSCWLWCGGVFAVGVVIEFVNRFGQLTMTWAMLGVMAAVTAGSWLATRGRRRLPAMGLVIVVISVPITWHFSFAGVGFGRDQLELWQTLGVTAPVAILLQHARTHLPITTALGLLWATSVGTAAWLWHLGSPHVLSAMIGAAAPSAVIAVLALFRRTIAVIGSRASADQDAEAQSRLELAEIRAAQSARLRWEQAGIRSSVDLLDRIADGVVDPFGAETQQAASREERHLRQILMLSPELVHVGPWLARALVTSRTRGVPLVVRTNEFDAPDADAAAHLGGLLGTAINEIEPGKALTVGLFAHATQRSFTLVGPAALLSSLLADRASPEGFSSTHVGHGEQGILEVSWDENR